MIQIKRILCPVDFSANAEHALQYALAFARTFDAELEILHAVEPIAYEVGGDEMGVQLAVQYLQEVEVAVTARLEELCAKAKRSHPKVSPHLAKGVAFVEIVRRAKEGNVDLIVIGTHGRTGLAHALMGSVSEKVVRKAPCPVLTVKHPEHDFVMP